MNFLLKMYNGGVVDSVSGGTTAPTPTPSNTTTVLSYIQISVEGLVGLLIFTFVIGLLIGLCIKRPNDKSKNDTEEGE